ncbi:DEAD/DEAH box helicase domain-containing protein [Halopelagius inordinatus]|uniref:DEAD/DEAH box helicase domain-containing protein n=1 Tax=Halopelagius inordinatus TaxID=553467 RepID=A0A1I2UYS3_9EURY|nr:DEAD/DEAH box helicase [Halopelagius inordinatus]SFG80957.1 DEAD/DEAH box helicase domain-containing protein [Halopelagius inordinatus]
MDDLVTWLRDRPYYEGQIRDHRRVEKRAPEFGDIDLEPRLASALDDEGIDRLYRHQVEAIEAVRGGENAVLATQTASGKSLAYTVPAFERAMDHGGRTLYLGPQNALVADQSESLSALARGLGFGSRVSVDQYTGRLSKTEKRDVRKRRPTVLLSNPDMLHYALLPHAHRLWEWFFSSLETVVIDEIHGYRGVFGSHVALTLRRLNRVCERYGSDPQYVCCSATIGNPVEHAARVTGREESSFRLVDEDTSGTGATHWVLWNPPEYRDGSRESGRRRSSHVETKNLFVDLLSRGYQTLAFTRARQAAERYATDSAEDLRERGERETAAGVAAYQAALGHEKRREIESGLHDGSVTGVWSTSALELGVDVGGLDAVLIDGYPGTRMSAFQQAGRAGRGDDDALVVLVGGEDQLDQYLMNHPEEFFGVTASDASGGSTDSSVGGEPERAISNPENEELLPDHVASAAAENWLSRADEAHFGGTFPGVVSALESAGELSRRETDGGLRWIHSGDGSPQHEMSLRTIESREVDLLDGRSNEVIASLSFEDALRDAHRGAIYHHQGQSYEVTELDLDRDTAVVQPTWADYYTRVLHDKTVTVEEDLRSKELSARPDTAVRFADVTMRKRITGFERRDPKRGEAIGRESLDLPETTLRTKALYFTVPADAERAMREQGGEYGFNGGIHAAEHGMISLFPLSFLCDRGDIGGLSTPHHPHTGRPTVFVYDGYPGGVGLTESGYDEVETLMGRTRRMIADCDCEDGCPACVQSPHCGNANDPLSKAEAVQLLAALTDD